ncbi:GTP pyrophosphokinase [Lachnoclostridium sp. An138]|uniref:GTP pyrophosphokinase n=1 Tax=Lachnoclostridium sp. An138 TaxID=1965560 RepID=UPI001FA93755|nr:GTP pyrophosphokinase family protein [Lachnoclostridium sp. An138]
MKNNLKNMVNRKVGNSEIVEVEQLNPEEEETMFLPIASEALNITEQYNQIIFFYEAGICQLTSKLEILKQEFQACKNRNPIENIETRVKSPESIKGKMERRGVPLTVSSMVKNIMDIAGIRVVCPFISDVYYIADFLLRQEDIEKIQLRTIAMEFWAALEHQLRYKKNRNRMEGLQKQLKQCAELITAADCKMQQLADQWL